MAAGMTSERMHTKTWRSKGPFELLCVPCEGMTRDVRMVLARRAESVCVSRQFFGYVFRGSLLAEFAFPGEMRDQRDGHERQQGKG